MAQEGLEASQSAEKAHGGWTFALRWKLETSLWLGAELC